MANNLGYTEGSGSSVATDDVAGVHYQVVKLAAGTEDSAERIAGDATNGLDVDVTRVSGTVTTADTVLDSIVVAAQVPSDPTDAGIGIVVIRDDSLAALGGLDGDYTHLRTDGTGALWVTTDDTIPVSNAGLTALNGAIAGTEMQVDILTIAAGDNNIGNVDIVTMPNVTLAAGTNTNEVVGDVAHDAGIAGNPITTSGVSIDMDDTLPPNRVNAEADATRIGVDRDGTQFVHPHGPQIWSYHVNGSTALTDATVHAAPGAGLSLYVTDIVFSSGAATAINAFFEEGASTVLGPYYLEAVAGRGMALHFQTPKKVTANTALTVTTSAAIAHSVDVTGFVAQG